MYRVAVIGLGFVGLSYIASFSSRGIRCLGIDIDKDKIESLNKGLVPVDEPGLSQLISTSIDKGLIKFTNRYSLIKRFRPDYIFISVDTPTVKSGQSLKSIKYVMIKLAHLLKGLRNIPLIVVKSTILPGTSRNILFPILERYSGLKIEEIGYVYNPEFLREGSALYDIRDPKRIVIGEFDKRSGDRLINFYQLFYDGKLPPIIRTTIENAELSKYASNLFLTCKLSFINSIAYICEKIGFCDVMTIKEVMGLDDRIGEKYLHPGIGFGGGCLPKDLYAFIKFIEKFPPYRDLFKSIYKINEYQANLPIENAIEIYGSLKNKVVTILGVSYKGGVGDIRGSQAIKTIRSFVREGAIVKVYDPKAIDKFIDYIRLDRELKQFTEKIIPCKDLDSCVSGSEYLVIATDWDEFKSLDPLNLVKLMKNPVIYDGRRILDPDAYKKYGIKFYGVGLSHE